MDATDPDAESDTRRNFFRLGARGLARWLGEMVQPSPVEPPLPPAGIRPRTRANLPRLLRPPGALPEGMFIHTCSRSAACSAACPACAIRPYDGPEKELFGTPCIAPAESPCVVCEDLACMPACPSGALKITPRELIRMGVAQVAFKRCLRSNGEECTTCIDACPIGAAALLLDDEGCVQVRESCVGCGTCEFSCPADPAAIVIRA